MKKKSNNPFKKGNPGGPGRPKHPTEVKQAARITATEFVSIASRFCEMTPEQLQAEMELGQMTNLEHIVASVIKRAIVDGDYRAFDLFMSRIIGKIPDNINITAEASISHLICEAAKLRVKDQN